MEASSAAFNKPETAVAATLSILTLGRRGNSKEAAAVVLCSVAWDDNTGKAAEDDADAAAAGAPDIPFDETCVHSCVSSFNSPIDSNDCDAAAADGDAADADIDFIGMSGGALLSPSVPNKTKGGTPHDQQQRTFTRHAQ